MEHAEMRLIASPKRGQKFQRLLNILIKRVARFEYIASINFIYNVAHNRQLKGTETKVSQAANSMKD